MIDEFLHNVGGDVDTVNAAFERPQVVDEHRQHCIKVEEIHLYDKSIYLYDIVLYVLRS